MTGCASHNLKFTESLTPVLLEILDGMDIQSDQFVICDYGCADGGVSLPLIQKIIEHLQNKSGEKLKIVILYEDIEATFFKNLFDSVNQSLPGNVFPMACGRSFYEQCFPPSFVNLGFSTTAMHNLSRVPRIIENDIVHVGLHASAEDNAVYRKQAVDDFVRILEMRCEEMAKGAHMVLCFSCYSKFERGNMYNMIHETLQLSVAKGLIRKDEIMPINFQIYVKRSLDDVYDIFNDKEWETGKKLKLIKAWKGKMVRPDLDNWKENPNEEIREEVGKANAMMIRKFAYGIVAAGLDPKRAPEEKTKILDQIFEELRMLVIRNLEHLVVVDHQIVVHFMKMHN